MMSEFWAVATSLRRIWNEAERVQSTSRTTYDGAAKSFNDDASVPEAGLRILIDEARKAANINRDIAINEVADFTVLREAQQEMGIKDR